MQKQNIRIVLLCLITLVLLGSTWHVSKQKPIVQIKKFIPLKSYPNRYLYAYEVTNAQYQFFIQDLRLKKEYNGLMVSLYDTVKTESTLLPLVKTVQKNYVSYYFEGAEFKEFPIVGITQEGASAFCKWLNLSAQEYIKTTKNSIFRLPTEAEWIAAVQQELNTQFSHDTSLLKPNTASLFHAGGLNQFYAESKNGILVQPYPSEKESVKPSASGFYHLLGNVSEMVSDGICKGGSFRNLIIISGANERQNYNLPAAEVGFRIVMDLEPIFIK